MCALISLDLRAVYGKPNKVKGFTWVFFLVLLCVLICDGISLLDWISVIAVNDIADSLAPSTTDWLFRIDGAKSANAMQKSGLWVSSTHFSLSVLGVIAACFADQSTCTGW